MTSCNHLLTWEEVSVRLYGQPKISKPAELKGVKEAFKVRLHSRCDIPVFITEEDTIYLKCRDYFSSEDDSFAGEGLPLGVRCERLGIKPKGEKFIYPDNWGSIVNRNEAWLKITGLGIALFRYKEWDVAVALEEVANEFYLAKNGWGEGVNCDWSRFISDLVRAYSKWIDEGGHNNDSQPNKK